MRPYEVFLLIFHLSCQLDNVYMITYNRIYHVLFRLI